MDCQKTMNLLSLYVDGSLDNKPDDRAIKDHLSACKACSSEFALQKRLSTAMNSFKSEDITAPPDLCANIMGQLKQERKKVFHLLPAAWRRTIAAVAAILLMAGMSSGITSSLLPVANNDKPNAARPSQVASTDNGVAAEVKPETHDPNRSKDAEQQPDSNANESKVDVSSKETTSGNDVKKNGTAMTNTESNTGEVPPGTTKKPTEVGQSSPSVEATPSYAEKTAFLSKNMVITSTVLKISVNDLSEAKIKAVALAAGAGASNQMFPEEGGLLMRLATPAEQAQQLISGLSGLGTTMDRQDENRDITSSYNKTSVQYAELQARISASTDTEERRQLESQAAGLKRTMNSYEADAGKRVIVLWIEKK
jgi:hypothetical protein